MGLNLNEDRRETSAQSYLSREFDTCVWGQDAQAVWQALREAGPVVRVTPDMVVATSTAAVNQVLRYPDVFSSNPAAAYFGSESGAIPLQVDPPQHSHYRKMLDPLFTPRKMAAREAEVTELVNGFIDELIERGSCDFAADFAVPFPSAMFLRLMGLPFDDLTEFLKAKEGMIRPVGDTEQERVAYQMQWSAWIFAYFSDALDSRGGVPSDDILGHFIAIENEGRLTRDETLNICLLLLAAGLDTVTDTLECAFAYLSRHPELQRRLVEEPEITAAAVEELMRFDTPVPIVTRITMSEVELAGCPVAAGQRVRVMLPSPNLDPELYADPDVVDFDREVNSHIAFGGGVHRCLGSHLARLELRVAVREWHRRIPSYTMREGTELIYRGGLREIEHLPLEFPPGSRRPI